MKTSKGLIMLPLVIAAAVLTTVALALCIVVNAVNAKEISKEAERKAMLTSDKIPNGVKIGGIDVGGMNYNEALLALQTVEKEIQDNVHFDLVYEDQRFELGSENFEITYNSENVVRKALGMTNGDKNVGYNALSQYMEKVKTEGVEFDLEYTIDATLLDKGLDEVCTALDIAPQNATAKVKENFKTNYSTVVNGQPFEFTKDVDGRAVDREKLTEMIKQKLDERDFGEIEIPVNTAKAEITYSMLKKNTVLRAYYYTSYAKGHYPERVHNLKTAANYCNGKKTAPGEIFSMEGTIGRRVDPNIWQMAGAVVDGGAGSEKQLGGGVCQVSTTLYNALVKSDLQIVYRKNHSIPSVYIDPGLDATINTDTIDFKWKNNTDYDVYIFVWLDTSREYIYSAVFGQAFPETFNRIEFKANLKQKIEPPAQPEYVKTSKLKDGEWCLKNKAITGYIYESYAYYYKGSTLVDTKYVDDSNYKMHPKCYYVWPGYTNGAALDPSLEMLRDEKTGEFYRRYSAPAVTPTPVEPSPTPTPVEPTPAEPTPNVTPAP